ncbi:MAG: bifunctional phosphopantothenoylcysteine decarboxylase/phosphopantothenate synthase [Sphingomonadales bacterium]|nr:bifunctional phosphopantothenoylcysteine decarboxylase/phosphopantothenate synthase [Sphingomonadales bacterium]MDE2568727.1 bifunctional phosphopantothenoylcysteine decarboxylase/phosphopantothenate synthase [Sphingomonadales bacterium]
MRDARILLIVGGGIAAYKSCELIRLIRKAGGHVSCVLTAGGQHFVTPMTLAALSGNRVHTSLWDLKDEVEMGHIELSRQADLVVVCPATADLVAKMAAGMADDLATTLLLATDKPVLAVPAMNVRMWLHPATQRNVEQLRADGIAVLDPDEGPMACGEFGPGRLPEPPAILDAIRQYLSGEALPRRSAHAPLALDHVIDPLTPFTGGDDGHQEDAAGGSRFAGLLSMIIPRRTPRPDGDGGAAWHDMPSDPVELPVPAIEPAEDEPASELQPGGPILARKGKAKSAPPTDRHAINHLVSGDAGAAPQPFEGEAGTGSHDGDGLPPATASGYEPLPIGPGPLTGRHVLVTAGPTFEAIDPVRYIANRSSGKQGYAIAAAAARLGARVTLVSGPVVLRTPPGVERIDIESAREMAEAVKQALPADIGIFVAAVADWRSKETSGEKIKKRGAAPPVLMLEENPDILATVGAGRQRPRLLVGFAAETDNVLPYAQAKLKSKGADWIVANDVSGGKGQSVMGGEVNAVHIVTESGVESLPEMPKDDVAMALVERMAQALGPVETPEE